MKTKILSMTMLFLFSIFTVESQNRTTVTANNSEISDNLDLRAVASIFGDSNNLDDFERRLNDPNAQISNLDLNGDNQVDYLRVIETVEGNAHLIVIQSVIGRDTFQDIATVEVARDRNNSIQVQVVGDVFMYGNNYIYEPVYAFTPVIYNSFWMNNYRPYCSSWNWGFYPNYYHAWSPFPIFTYQNHINISINNFHNYNYVNYRRCGVAYNNYYRGRRGNAYEMQHPNYSFSNRNRGYTNRYEMNNNVRNQTSTTRSQLASNGVRNTTSTRGNSNTRSENSSNGIRNNYATSGNSTTRSEVASNGVRNNYATSGNSTTRSEVASNGVRNNYATSENSTTRSEVASNGVRNNIATSGNSTTRSIISSNNNQSQNTVRGNNTVTRSQRETSYQQNATPRYETPRKSSQREAVQQKSNTQKSEGNSRGSKRG